MKGDNLFSEAALNKLRSPEKLDTLLPITSPLSWMGLIAVGLLVISVVVWSLFGSFTVRADGMGLVMDSGGLVNVSHAVGGKVRHIYVRSGSVVHKGDLIATIEQPGQDADAKMGEFGVQFGRSKQDVEQRAYQYRAKRYQQDILEDVISDYDGVVGDLLVAQGSIIAGGTPLCTVRRTRQRSDLTGLLYVPVDKGKRIEPGQTVQLVPNGVDAQESGSLIGVVNSVADYPIELQAMELNLGNPELARWIMSQAGGAVIEVTFSLVKDESSESGYLWTSFVGEHKPVTPGSFVTGSVIIERRPPIEKVFYKISQWLRSR